MLRSSPAGGKPQTHTGQGTGKGKAELDAAHATGSSAPLASARREGASPLWAGLAYSFFNSFATGVISNGIFFVTERGYSFDRFKNYALAGATGVVYIVGALTAGRVVAALRSRWGLSERGVLAALMCIFFVLCAVPQCSWWLAARGSRPPEFPIWFSVVAYNFFGGALWPIIESYVSGGRSGHDLRRALGLWNVVWSCALVFGILFIAPLIKEHAVLSVLLLGTIHILSLAILPAFPRNPPAHVEEHHEPHPPVYAKLLFTFRVLLPTSYTVLTALTPFLPFAAKKLASESLLLQSMTPIAWLLPRCVGFFVLDRWHGWHGRWSMPVVGGLLTLVGFAGAVLAPWLPIGGAAPLLFLGGLSLFGFGMSTIYTGAIYYAMAVGKAEVDAGGMHEGLIGVGYTVGPSFGLLAAFGVSRGIIPDHGFEPTVLGSVGVLALVVTGVVFWNIQRSART